MVAHRTRRGAIASYGSALATVAAVLLAEAALGELLRGGFLWMLPLVGVYAVSMFAGWGPGLLTIILFILGVDLFFLQPVHLLDLAHRQDAIREGLFVVLALAVWYLATWRRSALVTVSEAAVEHERTVAQLEDLLSMVSHDMRGPLNALNFNLYALGKLAEDSEEKFHRPLANAHRQIKRITDMIDRLLEPARMEDQKGKLQLELFDLAQMVRELVDGMSSQLEQANCAVDLDLEPVAGSWDRFRLERVLTNLLANAMKYGSGKTIIVRVAAEGDVAKLSVRDHGPGIKPGDLSIIFKRFARATSSEVKREGLGLGLYIAQQIVEAHGGTASVESEVGKGSTFIVTLPIKTQDSVIAQEKQNPRAAQDEVSAPSQPRYSVGKP